MLVEEHIKQVEETIALILQGMAAKKVMRDELSASLTYDRQTINRLRAQIKTARLAALLTTVPPSQETVGAIARLSALAREMVVASAIPFTNLPESTAAVEEITDEVSETQTLDTKVKQLGLVPTIANILRANFANSKTTKISLPKALEVSFGKAWGARIVPSGRQKIGLKEDIGKKNSFIKRLLVSALANLEKCRLDPALPRHSLLSSVYNDINYDQRHKEINAAVDKWLK